MALAFAAVFNKNLKRLREVFFRGFHHSHGHAPVNQPRNIIKIIPISTPPSRIYIQKISSMESEPMELSKNELDAHNHATGNKQSVGLGVVENSLGNLSALQNAGINAAVGANDPCRVPAYSKYPSRAVMNIRHSSKHADFGRTRLHFKNARIFVATLKRMPQQMQGPQACLWRGTARVKPQAKQGCQKRGEIATSLSPCGIFLFGCASATSQSLVRDPYARSSNSEENQDKQLQHFSLPMGA
uniref:Uncharacterized protein n=1 Tax=Coccidioides posadasii RMSCC 3488 TaxID=454284 RepID=A0A0J6FJC7_COCPO|nr:hypothetical protein CPAG_09560 [Coccidioides posadasii RMSCC 3488]